MAASREDIKQWFARGVESEATHLIVICDTYDYDDYPSFVYPCEDAREVAESKRTNMQKVMEVYNLSMSLESQLEEHRVFNY